MTDAPLEETWSPEPVKAWRYWRISDLEWNWDADRFEVTLIGDIEAWDGPVKFAGQHQEMVGRMEKGLVIYDEVDHRSPHPGCLCGINAVKSLDWDMLKSRSSFHQCTGSDPDKCRDVSAVVAVAPVELAGIVDEYEEGYRAEQATIIGPIRLLNGSPKIARILSSIYGVETIAEDWASAWTQELYLETRVRKANGHRKADPSNHRGTGTSQSTGTGEGTRKGWGKVADFFIGLVQAVGVFLAFAAVFSIFMGLLYGLSEWGHGSEDDARCVAMAEELGATAREVGTFWSCRVVLPSGVEISGGSFIVNE